MKKYSKLMAILLVFAMILAGVAQAAPVVEAEEVNSNVIRLSGADRIKTSVKISQTAYKDGAESVVIVGYEGEVDALAGTLLAHAKKGPVLFTKKGKLSEDTKTEIARLGAKNVYILGGTATIEDAVKTELETLKYTVKRISGSNREGTAAAVAKEVGGKTTHVFLARGYGDLRAVLSDALAVGPASAKGNMAVLLTRTDKVPAATLKSMKDLGVTNVTIVGGEVAVNSGVKTELETLKYTVDRLSGTTREGTAIAIANKYFAGKANALVANGYGSPDALVGGYLGAAIDAPILFSQANKVSEVTTDYLKANTEKAWILGGERVVNKEVLNKVLGAVVPTPTPPSTGGGSGDNVAVSAINMDVDSITLGVGETATITATVEPANATNKTVTWSTSDANIATVSNGVVTAVAEGVVTITATAGGKTAEAVITVLPVATGEEAADLLEWFVGWPTLSFHSEERGNNVGYDFKLKVGKISDLSDVTVSIFKGGTKIATNTLIDPSKWTENNGLTGSFYTNDIKETGSWYVEQISGALGEDIFDKLELRAIYDGKVYTVDQAELRPIVGNVKNLTQSKGYDTIQEAIAAATAGDVLKVSAGEYEVNTKIYINKNLTITGEEGVIFKSTEGNSILETSNGAKLTISGVDFIGTKAAGQVGIEMQANTQVEASDSTFTSLNSGIYANPGAVLNVTGSTFTNVLAGIGTDTAAENLNISGNTFVELGEAVGFTAPRDTKANFDALKADIIANNTGATDANVIAYGTYMGDLTEYNALLAAVKKEDYTTASWAAYQAKVTENTVTGANTQREIDVAIVNIKYAQMDLILATVKNTSQDLYYASIQDAIDGAVVGDNVIEVYPGDYGTEPIKIIQKPGVNITLEAVGEVVLKNQIKIDGNARLGGIESLTIKGFTFDFSDKSGDIITTVKADGQTYGYTHNVFIEDCTFIGNAQSSVVAVRASALGGHRNFQLDGCTGTNLHSLAQLTSVDGVTVKDSSVSVGEGGINLQNSTGITITNFTVDGTGQESYGVRAGQSSGDVNETATLTISDSNLNAFYPVWLRGNAPGTVTITNSNLEHIEGGKVINNVANGIVNITIDGAAYVSTEDQLKTALKDSSVSAITLGNDIELSDWVKIERPVKLDGNNKTIFGVKSNNGPVLHLNSDNIEIKHVTIKSKEFNSAITAGINIANGGHTGIVIDDVTFENTGYGVYANPDSDVTITNNIFKNLNSGIGIEGNGKIEANEFSEIKNNYVENASSTITNESIIADNNFDTTPLIDGINIKPAQ